jgi:hypothetical protein
MVFAASRNLTTCFPSASPLKEPRGAQLLSH